MCAAILNKLRMWMYENGHILSSCSHSVFIYHALFLIIMTSMMEMAISSGIDNDAAIWLMMSFSSSSKTPSAKAISTAQAKTVNLKSSLKLSVEAFTKAPEPYFFKILNSLSNRLS